MAEEIKGISINENERIDELNIKDYKIIQDPKRFCFGMDAVLLSGFCNVKKGERVLDLGTGNGVIPILLEAKTYGSEFIGIDIQKDSVELANKSIRLNKLENKVKAVECDIKNVAEIFSIGEFDVVTSNPPYMNEGGGLLNDYSPKAIARHEIFINIDELALAASKMLKFGGRFYMVHRPHRLADIICALRANKLEPKKIRFVHPFMGKEPNMVLIESSKNGNPMLKVMPPLYIYKSVGVYTDEINNIYNIDL